MSTRGGRRNSSSVPVSGTDRLIGLDEVLGQATALGALRAWHASGRLHHALAFVGPQGVGKYTVARSFGALLLCESEGDDLCGACVACRGVAANQHPDFHVVPLLWDDERRKIRDTILIEQIRDLEVELGRRSVSGRAKVAIIDPANDMNAPAQNALLKTLEEPPSGTFIILVAHNLAGLLPTVRSRCQVVRFAPLDPAALTTLLGRRGWSAADARLAAALAGLGLDDLVADEPERLRSLFERVTALRAVAAGGRHRDVVEAARQMAPSARPQGRASAPEPGVGAGATAKKRRTADSSPAELRALLHVVRAELRAAAGMPAAGELTGPGKTGTLESALRAAETVYTALQDLDANANRSLALERMWLRLAESTGAVR